MEGGTTGFDDWEMLLPESAAEEVEEEVVVAAEAEGLMVLRVDHFSIDDDNKMKYSTAGDERSDLYSEGGGSVESDNPSWIDPAAFPRRSSGELWPESASDRSKLSDCEEKLRLGFVEMDHNIEYDSVGDSSVRADFEGVEEIENMSVVAENPVVKMDTAENLNEQFGDGAEMGVNGEENCGEVEDVEDGMIRKDVEQPIHVEKKAILWWKLPLELVKFCLFRVSPVWSISVAAAMVGVFIIRRRLHMMKKRTKGLQMKVTMDEKKVDQFMSRAARLNEAFSVVRRITIIRPSLPAPGVTPWPVVSMR